MICGYFLIAEAWRPWNRSKSSLCTFVCPYAVCSMYRWFGSVSPSGLFRLRHLGLGQQGWVAVCPWPDGRTCALGCVLIRLSGCSLVCNPVHFRTLSFWGGYGYTVFLCIGTINMVYFTERCYTAPKSEVLDTCIERHYSIWSKTKSCFRRQWVSTYSDIGMSPRITNMGS